MTEHRETVPYTRELAVASVVEILREEGAVDEEEIQEDAELLVSRLMELGRAEELRNIGILHRGYEVESKTTILELRVEARKTWYRNGLFYIGAAAVGLFAGFIFGGPPKHLVILGPVLFLIFGALTLWQRRWSQRRLVDGVEKLRPPFEYASRLVDIGKLTETQREELNKAVTAARNILQQAEVFTKK